MKKICFLSRKIYNEYNFFTRASGLYFSLQIFYNLKRVPSIPRYSDSRPDFNGWNCIPGIKYGYKRWKSKIPFRGFLLIIWSIFRIFWWMIIFGKYNLFFHIILLKCVNIFFRFVEKNENISRNTCDWRANIGVRFSLRNERCNRKNK